MASSVQWPNRKDELCERLLNSVRPGLGASVDPLIALRVKLLLAALIRETGDAYVSDKAARINYWVQIARSRRRHDGYDASEAELFAIQDAYRLTWQIGQSARART